jgi:hypothetical protein
MLKKKKAEAEGILKKSLVYTYDVRTHDKKTHKGEVTVESVKEASKEIKTKYPEAYTVHIHDPHSEPKTLEQLAQEKAAREAAEGDKPKKKKKTLPVAPAQF